MVTIIAQAGFHTVCLTCARIGLLFWEVAIDAGTMDDMNTRLQPTCFASAALSHPTMPARV
jgi:hypothetical protein